MKKIVFALIIFILAATLPMAASAGKPAQLVLNIRNQTGAVVSVDLVDANGNHIYITLEEGVFPVTLIEGIYSYYAILPCGNVSGQWNINIVKTLFLSCKQSAPAVGLLHLEGAQSVSVGCYLLSWNGGTYLEFWDGPNWHIDDGYLDGGRTWDELVVGLMDWSTFPRVSHPYHPDGPPTLVSCSNPPADDNYFDHYNGELGV